MASKRQIWVKDVPIGGGAPVVVQSMTKTDTSDIEATVAQIGRMVDAGCELVRVAVPRDKDAAALETIVKRSPVPVIADIHFNHTLALKAIDAGAHCIRLNPGNIGGREKVKEVAVRATAAGVPMRIGVNSGSLKSAVGLGTLLADGVGDTIRISLSTFHAEEEVKVAWEILKALGLRERGPVLIACPTCGRLQFDMDTVVAEIEQRLERYEQPIEVAVLGCAVNGIGEASHADFGITGAKNEGMIFAHGKPLRKVPQDRLVEELFAEIDRSLAVGGVQADERKAAEAADWLERIERENAGEMTPERIAKLEAERTPEGSDEVLQPAEAVAGRRFNRART